jgi:hypothetical protein
MRQGLRVGSVVSLAALAVLAVPFAAGASATPAPAQAPAPAHWWQAEGNANDTPGPGVRPDNGTLKGAGFGPGVHGTDQAFSFAGGGQRVVFNKSGGNRHRGDFTFSFDVKTTATAEQATWGKRIACDTDGTPFWDFRMSGRGLLPGSIQFAYGTPPTSYGATSTTSINDGAWHQVAVTRHGVTVKLYIDGTLEATTTTPTAVNLVNNAHILAGANPCDGVDGTVPFTGELDELMIFRSALTQPQIQALGRAEGLTG